MMLRVGIKDVLPKLLAYQLLTPTLEMSEVIRLSCSEGDIAKLIADLAIHKLDVALSDTPIDPSLRVKAYSHLLGESDVVFVGTKQFAKSRKEIAGQVSPIFERSPHFTPHGKHHSQAFIGLSVRGKRHSTKDCWRVSGQRYVENHGECWGWYFPVASVIEKEVETIYNVEVIAKVPRVKEKFYAPRYNAK
jgi:LysR family transcriptional activator of nhaA